MSRLRVALLSHSVDEGGATGSGMERACAELIRHVPADIEFVVLSSDLPPDLKGKVEWHRVRLPRRPSLLRLLIFSVVAGWKLRDLDVDLVHTTGAIVPNKVSLATVHFCHAGFRTKQGRRARTSAPLPHRINRSVYRYLAQLGERWVYRVGRVAMLIAVSAGVAEEVRAEYPGIDVVVIANGVDHSRFRPNPVARKELRERYGVGPDDLVGLFVGGDWATKGLELAIRALGEMELEDREPQLWIVGDGDQKRYRALAVRCDCAERVRFFGPRPNPELFYAAADVFVLPSLYEAFSLVAYEAAACGIPVLGTEVSGLSELVKEGKGGLLIDREPAAIAAAIQRLAADDELRRSLGKAAQLWATRFTWSASANATFDIYRRLATRGRLGSFQQHQRGESEQVLSN